MNNKKNENCEDLAVKIADLAVALKKEIKILTSGKRIIFIYLNVIHFIHLMIDLFMTSISSINNFILIHGRSQKIITRICFHV